MLDDTALWRELKSFNGHWDRWSVEERLAMTLTAWVSVLSNSRSYVAAATDTSFSEAKTEAIISFCYQEDADHGGTACCRGVEG